MPKAVVFSCPSCGASLSVDEGAATTRCQFCHNTVIVPEELRSKKEPAAPAFTPGVGAPGMAHLQGQSGQLKELGNLIRSGNKIAAIKLYREIFGNSLAEAQAAVEKLAAGQSIQVMHLGMPTTITVDRSSTASMGGPTFTPTMQTVSNVQPVIITGNPGRSLGCVIWVVVLSVLLTVVVSVLAAGGALLPLFGLLMGGDLADQFGDLMTGVPGPAGTAVSVAVVRTATPEPTPAFASPVLAFGEEGTGGGSFHDPRHIGVDGEGNIYIGEWEEHRVQVFDPEGDFITQWSAGEDDAILVSMAVDRAGTVFAVAGGYLYYYDGMTGELFGTIAYEDERKFGAVSVTADGGLVTAWRTTSSDTIVRFNRDFESDLVVPEAINSVTGEHEAGMQLAADGSGTIFALGTSNDVVFRFSPEGVFQNQFGGDGDEPGQFTAPYALAVDNQSRVYVSDFKGIQVFDADGRYLDVFDVPDGGFVFGLAFGDGHLYAISNNSKVYKFALND